MKRFINRHSVLIFLLSLPALLATGWVLSAFLPDQLYYSPFTFSLSVIPMNLPFLIFAAVHVLVIGIFSVFLQRQKTSIKAIVWCVLLVAIAVADLIAVMASLQLPRKFYPGHAYCEDVLIAKVERCEGTDKGFMQGRLSAVARFGQGNAEVVKKITALPDYALLQTDCKDLPGGFGESCYTGSYQRHTGDTNYMNVYVHKDKILVLETENIAINAVPGDEPVFLPGQEPQLEDFLRLSRFSGDMTK